MKHKKHNRGFIALMSVIIISAIMLMVVYTLSASSFFSRFDSLDRENKRVSLAQAEACVSAAMLRVGQNGAYAGGQYCNANGICNSSQSPHICKICQVSYPSAGVATILARAAYNGAYTDLSVSINSTPGSIAITTWSELATYAGPSCLVP